MVQTERKTIRKTRTGTVVSDVNDQTVIVTVSSASRHRLYRKVIRRTKRYPVHDPGNLATVGDLVVIEECRPISKTKRWRLVDVVTERDVAEVAPETIDETLVDEVQRTAARAAAEVVGEAASTAAEVADEAASTAAEVADEAASTAAEVADEAASTAAEVADEAASTDQGAGEASSSMESSLDTDVSAEKIPETEQQEERANQ
jgi:small subunit ribosomal protein S17